MFLVIRVCVCGFKSGPLSGEIWADYVETVLWYSLSALSLSPGLCSSPQFSLFPGQPQLSAGELWDRTDRMEPGINMFLWTTESTLMASNSNPNRLIRYFTQTCFFNRKWEQWFVNEHTSLFIRSLPPPEKPLSVQSESIHTGLSLCLSEEVLKEIHSFSIRLFDTTKHCKNVL